MWQAATVLEHEQPLSGTLMGAPNTMLMGTWCGPAQEKAGAVMPIFFRPHLPPQRMRLTSRVHAECHMQVLELT